jgi:hypothetical protein
LYSQAEEYRHVYTKEVERKPSGKAIFLASSEGFCVVRVRGISRGSGSTYSSHPTYCVLNLRFIGNNYCRYNIGENATESGTYKG